MAIDVDYWREVQTINSYAIFMGYLLMGVRGLGLLVLTWTTVVLLGGFVSMLHKEDFWCLTVITLVQTAGVFDFLLKEKASDIGNYFKGMISAQLASFFRPLKKDKDASESEKKQDEDIILSEVAFILLLMVQLLVLAPVLCLVAVLYLLGLYISSGISLWRLIEHDYGGDAEGGANLKPALNVLYSLAVAQGVVFGYKTVFDLVARAGLVEEVANHYSLNTDLVKDYLEETVIGCMKDPSFARGRNLFTHAVGLLMESKSRYGYLSGCIIIGTILQKREYELDRHWAQQLLTGPTFFSHVIQWLMETFGPTSPYSTEIREHAARIVALVAPRILLEKSPAEEMIQSISSLLDTFEEYCWRPEGYDRPNYLTKEYERGWLLEFNENEVAYMGVHGLSQESDSGNPLQGYKRLVVQGLRILQGLAIHEVNCRVILSNAPDQECLLSKTMAPLICDKLHEDHHDEWSSIAEESMEFMSRLLAAPGDTGSKLRSEISSSGHAEIVANKILKCSKCGVFLKRQAIEILLDLPVDTIPSIIKSSGRNNMFIMGLLLHIFLLPDYCLKPIDFIPRYRHYCRKMRGSTHLVKRSSYIRKIAGEKLQHVVLTLHDESIATSMVLQSSVAAVVAHLARTSVDVTNNITYRLHVVRILEDLCYWYTKDDEYLKELKNATADIMPKVLKEILCFGSTSAGMHAKAEANKDQVSAQHTDVEKGVAPQGNGQEAGSSSQQQSGDEQHEGIKLQEALIFMCKVIYWNLGCRFIDLAEKTCLEQGIPKKNFPSLVWYAEDLLEKQKKAQGLATEG